MPACCEALIFFTALCYARVGQDCHPKLSVLITSHSRQMIALPSLPPVSGNAVYFYIKCYCTNPYNDKH